MEVADHGRVLHSIDKWVQGCAWRAGAWLEGADVHLCLLVPCLVAAGLAPQRGTLRGAGWGGEDICVSSIGQYLFLPVTIFCNVLKENKKLFFKLEFLGYEVMILRCFLKYIIFCKPVLHRKIVWYSILVFCPQLTAGHQKVGTVAMLTLNTSCKRRA